MGRHRKALGILHIIYGLFIIMITAGSILLYGIGCSYIGHWPVFSGVHLNHFSNNPLRDILFSMWFLVTAVTILSSIAGIIGGIGLQYHRNWARIMLLVVAVPVVLRVPLGTALGAYTLWILRKSTPTKLAASSEHPN